MKKLRYAAALLIILSLMCPTAVFAAEPEYDYDTIVNWNIRIAAPEEMICVLEGNEYGIYPLEIGSIPYVRVTVYNGYADVDEFAFLDELTSVMEGDYADLEIISGPAAVVINQVEYYEVDYEYSVSQYTVLDRRIAKKVNGRTYLFYSKEVEELDLTVDSLLDDVVANCVFLDADGNPVELEKVSASGDLQEIIWLDEYEDDLMEEGITGEFVPFEEAGFEMFIPDFMAPAKLPEDDPAAKNIIAYYTDEDGSVYIGIQYTKSGITLDQYETVLGLQAGVEDIKRFLVNGVEYIRYYMPDNDAIGMSCVDEEGCALDFLFYPMSDDEFVSLAEVFAASIRPIRS